MIRHAYMAIVFLTLCAGIVCCRTNVDEEAPEPQAAVDGTDASRADDETTGLSTEDATSDHESLEAMPEANEFRAGEGGATVSANAATIVAGDMRLELLANAVKEPTVVQIATRRPDDFDYPMPPGLLVGAGHGTPRDAGFRPVGRWHIPLMVRLEPGATLEVLSWNPLMQTWFNLGDTKVDASGTNVVFFTMVMGDVVLRKKPIHATSEGKSACEGPTYTLREEWPAKEAQAVGLSTVDTRIARDDAFRYLTDYRNQQGTAKSVFKNEETLGLWHRNAKPGSSYIDEDFLMDPNAAAALRMLEHWISDEWVDPFTGEATQQIRVTEAYDSLIEHSPISSHYHGRAIDLTLSPVPPPGNVARRAYYGRLARLAQCAGFDYVFFENNFHVHATVLPTKIAVLVRDSDGRMGILSGAIAEPERWQISPYRWDETTLDAATVRWHDARTVEVQDKNGTRALRVPLSGTRVQEINDPADLVAQYRNLLGTQELRVVKGHLYLVNLGGVPTIGSGDEDHVPVSIPTPTQYPLDDWIVLDAAFQPHVATQKAWAHMPNSREGESQATLGTDE